MDPQNGVDVLIDKANQVRDLPNVNELLQSVLSAYKDPSKQFWDESNKLNTLGKHWLHLKSNTDWVLNNEKVELSLFGPPIEVMFNEKPVSSVMLAISLPVSWEGQLPDISDKLKELLGSIEFKRVLFDVALTLHTEINDTRDKLYVPIFPLAPTENTQWRILIPFVSALNLP